MSPVVSLFAFPGKTRHANASARCICHGFVASLALAVVFGCWGEASAGEPQSDCAITRIQEWVNMGAYRIAEQEITTCLNDSPDSRPVGQERLALQTLLAEVYYRSEQYDDALQWAARSLAELPPPGPGADRVSRRCARARLLALSASARLARVLPAGVDGAPQEDWEAAEAELNEALELASTAGDRRLLLDLLTLRVRSAQKGPAIWRKENLDDRWKDLASDAEKALTHVDKERGPGDPYPAAQRALACYHAQAKRPKKVHEILNEVAGRLGPEDKSTRAVYLEVIRIWREAGDHQNEIKAWDDLRKLFSSARPTPRPDAAEGGGEVSWADGVRFRLAHADCLSQFASALASAASGDGDSPTVPVPPEAEEALHAAFETYRTLPAEIAALEDVEEVDRTVLQANAQRGILNVRRLQGVQPGSFFPQSPITARQRLYDCTKELCLEKDPELVRLRVLLAAEHIEAGEDGKAAGLLVPAVDYFDRRVPGDHAMRVRVRLLLFELDVKADLRLASKRLTEASDICTQKALSDDSLALRIELARGRLKLAAGHFKAARELLEPVKSRAESLHPPDEDALCVALLELGIVYNTFGRLEWAKRDCTEALRRRATRFPEDSPQLLPYYLGVAEVGLTELGTQTGLLSGLATQQRRGEAGQDTWKDVVKNVKRADSICGAPGARSPLDAEVRHQQALLHFLTFAGYAPEADAPAGAPDDAEAARQLWKKLLLLPEQTGFQRARTKHYLSRLALVRWRRAEGDRFEDTLADYLETKRQWTEDVEKYKASCRDFKNAMDGVTLEKLRGEYERLNVVVRNQIENLQKDLKDLQLWSGGASSTQSGTQAGGGSLLQEAKDLGCEADSLLSETEGHALLHYAVLCNLADASDLLGQRDQAAEYLERAIGLIEEPLAFAGDDDARNLFLRRFAMAYDLLVSWHVAQDDRSHWQEALVWAEMRRNRTLLDSVQMVTEDRAKVLHADKVRAQIEAWLPTAPPSLYYYLGSCGSFVFLILDGHVEKTWRLDDASRPTDAVGFAEDLSSQVEQYCRKLKEKSSRPDQPDQRPNLDPLLRRRLLPEDLFHVVKDLNRRVGATGVGLAVFPDAELYGLPFEAIVAGPGPVPKYLLEVLPPLTYVPSIMFAQRKKTESAPPDSASFRLVIVAKENFKKEYSPAVIHSSDDRVRGFFPEGMAGGLEDLDWTRKEADTVKAQFWFLGPERLFLYDLKTTKETLCDRLTGADFVLFSTHGLVDEPNDRAALALNVPTGGSLSEGLFQDRDIPSPLHCRLVFLSACSTNVGGDRPLEMRASLARAFLSAGASRVVSTQWEIGDKTSADLVGHFFGEIAKSAQSGEPCDYASALCGSKRKLLLSKGKSSAPYYWAPFVLLGSPRPSPSLGPALAPRVDAR